MKRGTYPTKICRANREPEREPMTWISVKGKPPMRVPFCECGEAAVTEVYFYTLTSEGSIRAQTLKVCEACREMILAEDPGASDMPLPDIPSPRSWRYGNTQLVTKACKQTIEAEA